MKKTVVMMVLLIAGCSHFGKGINSSYVEIDRCGSFYDYLLATNKTDYNILRVCTFPLENRWVDVMIRKKIIEECGSCLRESNGFMYCDGIVDTLPYKYLSEKIPSKGLVPEINCTFDETVMYDSELSEIVADNGLTPKACHIRVGINIYGDKVRIVEFVTTNGDELDERFSSAITLY